MHKSGLLPWRHAHDATALPGRHDEIPAAAPLYFHDQGGLDPRCTDEECRSSWSWRTSSTSPRPCAVRRRPLPTTWSIMRSHLQLYSGADPNEWVVLLRLKPAHLLQVYSKHDVVELVNDAPLKPTAWSPAPMEHLQHPIQCHLRECCNNHEAVNYTSTPRDCWTLPARIPSPFGDTESCAAIFFSKSI